MYFGVLDTYQQYTSEVNFTVPQSLPTGDYVVVVFADVFGTLFEFNMKENNKLMKKIKIVQQFPEIKHTPPPDLQVDLIITPKNVFSGKLSFYIQCLYVYICMHLMYNPNPLKGCILLNLF